jgi:hypothetical protein
MLYCPPNCGRGFVVVFQRRDRLVFNWSSVRLQTCHSARDSPANGSQPFGEAIRISQGTQPLARNRERLLCGILRQMLIEQSAARDRHSHTVVSLVQLAKTLDVTGAGRLNEFPV